MVKNNLSVVIPCFNEEKTLEAIVKRVLAADIGDLELESARLPAKALQIHPAEVTLVAAIELVHPLVLAGDDDIDAVGAIPDVFVDPLQFHLELLGGETHRPEDPEAAGLADRHDDVPTVGKGKNGQIDPELFTEFRLHPWPPAWFL